LNLISLNNLLEVETLNQIEFDLIICASGFEERASFLVSNYRLNSKEKICLSFNSFNDRYSRKRNDEIFASLSFSTFLIDGNSRDEIIDILTEFENHNSSEVINVLVDYSSMTRIWYATIINYFRYKAQKFNSVNLFFCYSVSKYIPPPAYQPYTSFIEPIDGFFNLSIPDKPSALIIGLGYEKDRAFGLKEYFDADEVYLFLTEESSDKKYTTAVIENNKSILRDSKESNTIRYTLFDLNNTDSLLYKLCKDLSEDFRVILAPCGPKPFTLICYLTNYRINSIDVWRISGGKYSRPVNKIPTGKILCLELNLIKI
jgi:hypothetical protein